MIASAGLSSGYSQLSPRLAHIQVLCAGSLIISACAFGQGTGYWHTDGNRILDSENRPVRIAGINWNGFDGDNYVLHGLWGGIGRSWLSMLDQIKALGYNTIRLPFSAEALEPGRMPLNIDYSVNPDLAGKTSLEIMDAFVVACRERNLRVILDYHRMKAGSTPESGLWYSDTHPESLWISNLRMLASRYKGNPTVIGIDLFNEPHAATWDADGVNPSTNWRTAAKRAGDAVLEVNPGLLIFVQGLGIYKGDAGWWGAVHLGVKEYPLVLSVPNKLVYSVHDYPETVYPQPWFSDSSYPENLPTVWDHYWGFIHNENIAPIWIGELGTKLQTERDQQWFLKLRDYIAQKGLSWTFWTWNPNSGDTGGLLKDDWTSIHENKQAILATIQFPLGPAVVDSDGDGLPDAWEERYGLDPLSPDSDGDGLSDDLEDLDGDGRTNLQEYLEGTEPIQTSSSSTAWSCTNVQGRTGYGLGILAFLLFLRRFLLRRLTVRLEAR